MANYTELKELLKETSIPTVFTRFSDDILADNHEMNFGVVGAAGANREANFLVQNADLVLSVGCRLSIDTTGPQVEAFAREANIIVVDIDKDTFEDEGEQLMYVGTSRARFKLSCIVNMTEDECLLLMEDREIKHNRNILKSFATAFNAKVLTAK